MDYAPYVLFRENSTNHTMQFITRGEDNRLVPTKLLNLAIRFETSALAYAFGVENGLQWWRVGKR